MIATPGFIGTAFAFPFVDFFDTAGTLTSVAHSIDKVNKDGEVEGIYRVLLADSSNFGRSLSWYIQYNIVY